VKVLGNTGAKVAWVKTTYSIQAKALAEALVRLCGVQPDDLGPRLYEVKLIDPEAGTEMLFEWTWIDDATEPMEISIETNEQP